MSKFTFLKLNIQIGIMLSFILLVEPTIAQDELTKTPPSPEPTFVPTLTPDQIAFEELLQTNGGCELPCWWGFNVGKSTQAEWLNFLDSQPFHVVQEEPLSTGELVPTDYAYFSFPASHGTAVTINHYFESEILSRLNIKLDDVRSWLSDDVTSITLPNVLASLEYTPELYSYGRSIPADYTVLLVDDKNGIMIEYAFDFADESPNWEDLNMCLDVAHTKQINITILPANSEQPISQTLGTSIGTGEDALFKSFDYGFPYKNADEFIKFFKENPDQCLYVGEYIQQRQQK